MFLPMPEGLLVNLSERKELVVDLLQQLPAMFANSHDTKSALGAALTVAHKLMVGTEHWQNMDSLDWVALIWKASRNSF